MVYESWEIRERYAYLSRQVSEMRRRALAEVDSKPELLQELAELEQDLHEYETFLKNEFPPSARG